MAAAHQLVFDRGQACERVLVAVLVSGCLLDGMGHDGD
jgi:hypothetical protein